MRTRLAFGLSLVACAAQGAALEPSDHRFALEFGGLERSYIVHVPPKAGDAPAVILNFHGGGGEARAHQKWRSGKGTHTATRVVFSGCRDGVEVVLWKLTGSGHVWPGGMRDYLTRWLGPSTQVIDANEEMWGFFRRFTVHGPRPVAR